MIIPALIGLIPTLVKVADNLFDGGKGAEKKTFVQGVLETLYDKFLGSIVYDSPSHDEKEIFVKLSSYIIDATVANIRK